MSKEIRTDGNQTVKTAGPVALNKIEKRDADFPDVFISVYMPVAGWKAIMLAVDDKCGGDHTPHGTGYFAYRTKAAAIREAKNWAKDEEIPFIDTNPEDDTNAPDESISEQIAKALGIQK